jgi:NitT/TauT family transport system substrate-binding protein
VFVKQFIPFLISIILAAVTACSPNQAATPTPAPTQVSIQLSWVHEYSSSVFHTAVRNGHFAAQGLEPILIEGGFDEQGYIDPLQEVINGEVDFALSNSPTLIEARAAGQPIVAVASVLQRSPLAVISLAEAEISRPQDLVGKTVSVAAGGAQAVYDTLLHTQEIDPSSVNTVERTSFGIDPLINGEVDALVAWIINEGVAVQEQGLDPNYILMSDYGVDSYDFVVFTTETMIAEHPEIVQGVVTAVREGAQDVVDNPAEAIENTLTYNGELVREEQLRRLEATIPLINVPGQQIGGMDANVWQFTQDFMLQQGILEAPIDLEEVYTLEFLPSESA